MDLTTVVMTVLAAIVLLGVTNWNFLQTHIFPLFGMSKKPARVRVRTDNLRKRR